MSKQPNHRDDDDDDDDYETNTVDVINISSEVIRFEIDGTRYKLKPRDVVKINKAYGLPVQMQPDKDPLPSTVERLTNKKVLAVSDTRARAAVAGLASAPQGAPRA